MFHGDVKAENTLVTSWNWLYLTDFSSSFKPTYLPEDNPADFSFYFDIAGRRTCYLAPERFLSPGEKPEGKGSVTWAMDIFSVGCVIAELFLETPIFNLSQLFKYRKKEYDPEHAYLSRIEDPDIKELIEHMIQVEPESRFQAEDYLNFWRGKAFPEYFYTFLHQYMHLITDPTSGRTSMTAGTANLGESDERINRVYYDFDKISYLLGYDDLASDDSAAEAKSRLPYQLFPLHLDIPNKQDVVSIKARPLTDDGTLLFLNLVTSAIRSTARATARTRACELLLAFSERLTDEAKLDRVLPFVMSLIGDKSDIVKIAALRTLTQLVALVSTASPVNAYLFPEYILPKLESFTPLSGVGPSPLVRITYASCMATLAETASRFLDVIQALKADGSLPPADTEAEDGIFVHAYQNLFDVARADLVRFFESQTKALLTDTHPDVKRAFLGSVSSLCIFFGSAKANDVILSHLNTYLNDKDWRLKYAFFETIVGVATFVGGSNLEEFILPLMVQALADPEEAVVEKVLRSLATMAQLGLFQRSVTWELVDLVGRFTMHPNIWIREAAAHFLSSAVKFATPADTQCIIKPLVEPYLRVDPLSYSELDLLDSLKRPFPRICFDMAVNWATKAEKGVFWQPSKQRASANTVASQMPVLSSKSFFATPLAKLARHEEDQLWIAKLRNAGMTADDDVKLVALRDHIWRMANRRSREDEQSNTNRFNKIIPLKDLKIAPETVFFDHEQQVHEPLNAPVVQYQEVHEEPQTISDALLDAASPLHHGLRSRLSIVGSQTPSGTNSPGLMSRRDIPPRIGSPFAASPSPSSTPIIGDLHNRMSKELRQAFEDTGSPIGDSHSFLSPNNRIGQLKHNHALHHKGSAIDLMQRKPSIAKAEAEISTSSANVLGTVNGSGVASRSSPLMLPDEKYIKPVEPQLQGVHTYSGRDPNVLRLLDALYLENHPIDASEFGPLLVPVERRTWDKKGVNSAGDRWRPEGNLIAVFNEHTGPVVRVIVAPDHSFFITGSEDGTVKIWDCARLERNLSHRSKQTYKHGTNTKITTLCFVQNSHCFVSTASNGTVHIVKVDYTETSEGSTKYGKPKLLRQYTLPDPSGHVVWSDHFRSGSQSVLLLGTNTSQIHALDVQTMTVLYTLENPIHHGSLTCFCIDTKHYWLLVGTSHGVLNLWDLRFKLRVRSWGFPGGAPIHRVCLHPIRGTRRKQVIVAGGTGSGDITIWDLEKLTCKEVYRTAAATTTSTAPSHPSKLVPIDSSSLKPYTPYFPDLSPSSSLLAQLHSPSPHPSTVAAAETTQADRSVRALATGFRPSTDAERDPRHGFLLAAGPDRKVRFWDLDRVEASCVVSGIVDADEAQPVFVAKSLVGTTGVECVVCEERVAGGHAVGPYGSSPGGASPGGPRVGAGASSGASKPASANTQHRSSRSTMVSMHQQRLLKSHLDCVLDVALVEFPVNMVVSVDRAGAVMVFS